MTLEAQWGEKSSFLPKKCFDDLTTPEFLEIYEVYQIKSGELESRLQSKEIDYRHFRSVYTQMTIDTFGLETGKACSVSSDKLNIFTKERKDLEDAYKNFTISPMEFMTSTRGLIKDTFSNKRHRLPSIKIFDLAEATER